MSEGNRGTRRAKVRIGIATALLVIAAGILAVLSQRQSEPADGAEIRSRLLSQGGFARPEKEAIPAAPLVRETPQAEPGRQTSLSPSVAEQPPATPTPGQSAPTTTEAENSDAPQAYAPSAARSLGGNTMSAAKVEAPSPVPAKPADMPAAYVVQLGVFADMENARQLQTRLAQHGIATRTETRVQMGPFKSRGEADQAREKLKALGIKAVVIRK